VAGGWKEGLLNLIRCCLCEHARRKREYGENNQYCTFHFCDLLFIRQDLIYWCDSRTAALAIGAVYRPRAILWKIYGYKDVQSLFVTNTRPLAPMDVCPSSPLTRPRNSTISPPRRAFRVTLMTSHSTRILSSAKTARRNFTQYSRPTIDVSFEK